MIHRALKKLRLSCGHTQQEVADYLHMSQNTISKIESGCQKIDVELFIKLTAFYKVTPQHVLNECDLRVDINSDNIVNKSHELNELIVTLTEQLKEKDKQIEVLMSIIRKKFLNLFLSV